MKLLPLIFSICLITHYSLAYGAESFSFSGIQWTDTRDVISKKLKETNEFEGLRKDGIAYNQIVGGFPSDFIKNNKLSNINNELLKCGYESIVRVMADVDTSNADGIICRSCHGGLFYFSAFDEKLLYYEIDIKLEMKDSVLQSLQKKYGQGRDFGGEKSNLLMWETDNELLFISRKSGQLL